MKMKLQSKNTNLVGLVDDMMHEQNNNPRDISFRFTMITQGISKENYALVEYAQKEGVEMETINRIIEQTSKTIEQKDKALTEKDNTIEQKDKALTQEREKNARQQKKIEYLQEQLRLKNG